MPEVVVSDEEFIAAKGDPEKIPSLGGTAPGEEPEQPQGGNITDIRTGWTIAGLKARPVSGGVIAILEEIDHPMMVGEDPEKMSDIVAFLYILTCQDEGLLVDQALDGTLKREAIKWSLILEPDVLAAAVTTSGEWMAEAGKVMEDMAGTENATEAKKNSG